MHLQLIKLVSTSLPKAVNSDNGLDLSDSGKEWQVMGPKNKGSITRRTEFNKTPISAIFGGLLRSRIHKTGEQDTDNIQPFFTLQLNIEVSYTTFIIRIVFMFLIIAGSYYSKGSIGGFSF